MFRIEGDYIIFTFARETLTGRFLAWLDKAIPKGTFSFLGAL